MGYYVNNEYTDESLAAEPPKKAVVEKVRRNILAEKPRVTRFAIKWDSEESAPAEFPPEQPEADAAEDDAATYGADEDVEEEKEAVAEEGVVNDEDADMEGVEANAHVKEEDEESNAGSEDLEAESSGSEDEEEEEEAEEAEGEAKTGEDMEMDDGKEPHTPMDPIETLGFPGTLEDRSKPRSLSDQVKRCHNSQRRGLLQ